MTRFRLLLTVLLLVAGGGCMGRNAEVPLEQQGPLVNCYDEERDVVGRKFVNDCAGRIVGDDEAARIGWATQVRPRAPTPSQNYRLGSPLRRLVATGTGFFVNGQGDLLTSHHVVADCSHVSVSPAMGGSHIATVEATDKVRDLALLQVPFTPQGVAHFARDPGQAVANGVTVMGYPERSILASKPATFKARILGIKNAAPKLRVIGFQGKVRPGNSGGPLIDRFGYVVGVVFAKAVRETGNRQTNIGFAIPGDAVMEFMDDGDSRYTVGSGSAKIIPVDLLAIARAFIARVGCWR
jgi:serine protease Do